uniref:hypothetical protein n=1 Tax=Microbacterium azadirachtae TaxID=582680 RepID=UPI000B85B9BA|nr:hypothetical protein [Microbacterium azadirachtae]
MSVEGFPAILWSATGLIIAALSVLWWLKDRRERREAQLVRRWNNATIWNPDTTARVVRLSRAEPGRGWLDDGEVAIEVNLPDQKTPPGAGWYLSVTGWVPARRAALKGRIVRLGAESVQDVFPPDAPAVTHRMMGRGERRPGVIARLLGFRGL